MSHLARQNTLMRPAISTTEALANCILAMTYRELRSVAVVLTDCSGLESASDFMFLLYDWAENVKEDARAMQRRGHRPR